MLSFPINPMLLQATGEPFDSPDCFFEWKVDGCNVGLGVICYDRVVKESVIKGVGNVEGAPSSLSEY